MRAYLWIRLGSLVVTLVGIAVVGAVVFSDCAAADSSRSAKNRSLRYNRTPNDSAGPRDAITTREFVRSSSVSAEHDRRKLDARFRRISSDVRQASMGADVAVLSQDGGRERRHWRRKLRVDAEFSPPGIGSDFSTALFLPNTNASDSTRPRKIRRRRSVNRQRRRPIYARVRLLTRKLTRSANRLIISFRSSSPFFWQRQKVAAPRQARRRRKKTKAKERRRRKWRKKGQRKKKVKKKKKKHKRRRKKKGKIKGGKGGRKKGKKQKVGKRGKTELLDIIVMGKALKSRQKTVSAKKYLKQAIAKQLKRKIRKMSRRANKVLARSRKSKRARERLLRSKMAAAVRLTVRQVERVCRSLTAAAHGTLGSSRVRVRCRFGDAERLLRRFEKSRRSATDDRKLAKTVSGVMAAVAAHMRPLVDLLYQQTLSRRRTAIILSRLRSNVADVSDT